MEFIKELLDAEATRINSPSFIADDPVQFPRRFSALPDIEIVSLLSATIAWGKRTMICRDAERLLAMMNHDPYRFVMDEAYERLDPQCNVHRTFFVSHLQYLLRGLRQIYLTYPSLDTFCASRGVGADEFPSWRFAALLGESCVQANEGEKCTRALPFDLQHTALKRINMALRWLVRDDGIVDMGVWKSIPKSKLFIPLDVHVGNVARQLGLLTRRGNDRRSVEELTHKLRLMRPEDPVWYDYALFGIGVYERLGHLPTPTAQ